MPWKWNDQNCPHQCIDCHACELPRPRWLVYKVLPKLAVGPVPDLRFVTEWLMEGLGKSMCSFSQHETMLVDPPNSKETFLYVTSVISSNSAHTKCGGGRANKFKYYAVGPAFLREPSPE